MDDKMKPIISMAIKKIKIDKEPMEKESFEKEGLRAASEQMMIALNRLNQCYDRYMCEKLDKRENESTEEFALRVKEEAVSEKIKKEKRDIYIDAFMKALCGFIEMKFDLEPKDNSNYKE